MLALASMIPKSVLLVPSVAELPIAQFILSFNIPPSVTITAPVDTVRADGIMNVHEAPAVPVSITGPVIRADEAKQRTGVTLQFIGDRVDISVAPGKGTPLLQGNALSLVKYAEAAPLTLAAAVLSIFITPF
jgi:hypothetical protein